MRIVCCTRRRIISNACAILRTRPAVGAEPSGFHADRGRRHARGHDLLYVIVPKGLLPQQDTGLIIGVTDAAEAISFKAMVRAARHLRTSCRQDPGRGERVGLCRRGHGQSQRSTPAALHRAQAARPAQRQRGGNHRPPARKRRRTSRASRSSCRRRRMCRSTAASAAPNTNTLCRTPTRPNWRSGRRSCCKSLGNLPELADVASDQQSTVCNSTSMSTASRPRA